MLELKFIVDNADLVRRACDLKKEKNRVDDILRANELRKTVVMQRDANRAELNSVSGEIAKHARSGGDVSELKERARKISDTVSQLEERLRQVEEELAALLLTVPNIPHDSVPVGNTAEDNPVIRSWGCMREFEFDKIRDHISLNESLKIFDFDRGAKISGASFPIYMGQGARLVRSIIAFMLDFHTKSGKYKEVFPPFLVNRAAMTGTGQLPKLENDMYHCDLDDLFLIPTGEVPVTNLHSGEVLQEADLPIRYTCYSGCFRREAGSYGKDTRGLMRLHQFDKVELVKIAHPDNSFDELEDLTADAEAILRALELPYRVIVLCTGDLTFGSAKTYDIELWAPGAQKWLEVSSCSNLTSFQARRMNTRFRSSKDGKLHFVHTLNGSGVAMPRLLIAILENYQNADGSITVPQALVPYFGAEKILPA